MTPLPAPLADDSGAVRAVADKPDAFPCRRCLRDADVGEAMLLLGYDPFLGASPYAGRGPIYVHERDCSPFAAEGLPRQLTRRLLSIRAYDDDHMLVDAEVAQGTELAGIAEQMLERDAAYIHVHNARPGCFAARIDR